MGPCVWYVSKFKRPWEGIVVANLAASLRAQGVSVKVYVEGGTAHVPVEGVLSWNSLTFFERAAAVLFRGKLWHLWGKPPFWWPVVRLRARTVHTSLDDSPVWAGHPTRLFAKQAREGESIIKPTFEVKVAWAGGGSADEGSSALLLAMTATEFLEKALSQSGMAVISLAEGTDLSCPVSELEKGKMLLVDDSPSNVLLASYLTLQGLPVVARTSSLMQSLLGKDGYIAVEEDSEDAWKKAIEYAGSEEGRKLAASARRFLKANFTASNSFESLSTLYRSVMEGKS